MTITHKLGSVVIPAEPRRVVALGGADADIAVALGVLPVAMAKYSFGTDGLDQLEPGLTKALG